MTGEPGVSIYNLGTDETVVVDESVAIITEHLGLSPEIEHTGGRRGWTGDSPLIHLDTREDPRARLGAATDASARPSCAPSTGSPTTSTPGASMSSRRASR